jgi:hypothetical protein
MYHMGHMDETYVDICIILVAPRVIQVAPLSGELQITNCLVRKSGGSQFDNSSITSEHTRTKLTPFWSSRPQSS